jgi:TRAP-type C4-dicarboxylate transport system substrate-binding protein
MKHRCKQLLAGMFLALVAIAAPATAQTIKIATLAPDGSAWMKELRAASAEIKAGTQGRVDVKYYPGGVMGNDAVVLRKMRLGQLQGGVLTSSELAAVYPDAPVYSLPFLLQDWDQVKRVRAQVDPLLAKGFEGKGLHMLGATGIGFAYVMSTRPVHSRAEMVKSKLWIPQGDVIADVTFRTGGVTPIPLPIGDVFTSLQTGLVDTVANTPSGTVALQWHGKLKYMIDLPLSYVVGFMVMDQKAWQKLSPADQAIVTKAFNGAAARMDASIQHDDESALKAMQKQGLKVISMDAAETARWREIGAQVTRKLEADKTISPAMLSAVRKAVGAGTPVTAGKGR